MKREKLLNKNIGVIYGGLSAEREVSLETGQAFYNALIRLGYKAKLIDMGRDLPEQLIENEIDVAMLGLHGKWGEDGSVQGLLEVMGIPYAGTGVFGSSLAMNKKMAKLAFEQAGLPVAKSVAVSKESLESFNPNDIDFGFPWVVKPNSEGSSVGITFVKEKSELRNALEKVFKVDQFALIEEYFSGKEVSVSVLNGESLGIIWIKPAKDKEFYDFSAKYLVESTEYIYPAPLDSKCYNMCMEMGRIANDIIRGRGATRTDIIVQDDGKMAVLEINTLPGMTAHSLVPKTANGIGIDFDELTERILLSAQLELFVPEEKMA